MPKNRLTDAEREQRRAQDRERLKQAAEQLLTSEAWQRWVRVRSRNDWRGTGWFSWGCVVVDACNDGARVGDMSSTSPQLWRVAAQGWVAGLGSI